jgi:hypothetical protein
MTHDALYRDPLASLRSHVAALREALPPREEILSPLRRAVLPEETVRALSLAYDAQTRELTDETDLTQVERDVFALREAVARAEALVERAKRDAQKPLGVPLAEIPSLLMSSACELPMFEVVRAQVAPHDGDVTFWAPSLHAVQARFSVDALPLLLLGRTTGERNLTGIREDAAELFLQAPIPLGLSLLVRPSGVLLGVVRRVPWVRRVVLGNPELGDTDFEDAFSVSGGDGVPAALLVPRLRRWLTILRESHRFVHLRIAKGRVDLAWQEPYEGAAPRALPRSALEVVTGLAAIAAAL